MPRARSALAPKKNVDLFCKVFCHEISLSKTFVLSDN